MLFLQGRSCLASGLFVALGWVMCMRSSFGVQRLAFGVWRLAFGVWRLAFRVYRSSFGVWRLAFSVWRLAFIVHRSAFIVHRSSPPGFSLSAWLWFCFFLFFTSVSLCDCSVNLRVTPRKPGEGNSYRESPETSGASREFGKFPCKVSLAEPINKSTSFYKS